MAAEHWFRWHHGTVSDPKWRVVAARACHAMSRNVTTAECIAVWAAMLERASQANPRGSLEGWDDEDVGAGLGLDPAVVAAIREAMQGKVLSGNDVSAWIARQPKREDNSAADRKRAQRDRQRDDVTNRDSKKSHAESHNVTLETETETDKKEAKAHVQQAARVESRFEEFWAVYPVRKGRASAEAKWRARKLDAIADRIIADVKARMATDRQWLAGYIPHGSTYVNGSGWQDAIEQGRGNGGIHASDDAMAVAR